MLPSGYSRCPRWDTPPLVFPLVRSAQQRTIDIPYPTPLFFLSTHFRFSMRRHHISSPALCSPGIALLLIVGDARDREADARKGAARTRRSF